MHWTLPLHYCLYNFTVANGKTKQYHKFNHFVDYHEQQNCLSEFKKLRGIKKLEKLKV